MKHRHFSPKRFFPPKARRSRVGRYDMTEELKDIWTDGWMRPWWAKLARERGWMTNAAFYAVPRTERDPRGSIADIVYRPNPLLQLIRKDVSFAPTSE